ncbi:site-specific DNA-methyltransferase [Rhodopseudomonas sp. BR0G17]|uniref:site-specific DNA-methyltransferase n=1 Tax=Rhodopseudomonas sp. BR0G17 TaxID=2269368 RepID=UPI0013DF67A0|nr:site-specific DNA-methyltransferase [Rhodopseudomonas sp. BR0G17]NEW96621.1 site-specific DNA-methyltransferase [Rhodopseudomonas sp. BR0G17]
MTIDAHGGEALLGGRVMLHAGDSLAVLDTLAESSIDACVCDPPYHLTSIVQRFGKDGAAPAQDDRSGGAYKRTSAGFMGKQWDGGDIAFRPDIWRKVYRVLKPGAHLLAFGASRGFGRMQVAIEDAGFETRDCILDMIDADARIVGFLNSLNDAQRAAFLQIVVESGDVGGLLAWVFGSGFPKSHAVSLDFEKTLCEPRKVGGVTEYFYLSDGEKMRREAPFRHDLAQQFAGFGSALKPAFEPIVMARKPLIGSIADNVAAFGTGAINIDAARITADASEVIEASADYSEVTPGHDGYRRPGRSMFSHKAAERGGPSNGTGRFPANVIHDGSAGVIAGFPAAAGGGRATRGGSADGNGIYGSAFPRGDLREVGFGDGGSAARFFYSAKADAHDRVGSKHPTIKPVDVIQYLVRLSTAPGQVVLDPFAGTGTTGEAAFREGRRAVLIEREAEYRDDIRRRMALALAGPDERKRESVKAKIGERPFEAGSLFADL